MSATSPATRAARLALAGAALRCLVVLGVLLSPLPFLADSYATFFAGIANPVLFVASRASHFDVRVEPPETIAAQGNWKPLLRVTDRQTEQTGGVRLDVRTFSYRPLAAFLALAAAWPYPPRRRSLRLLAYGLPATLVATLMFTGLAILSRFASGGYMDEAPALVARTAYQALATPVMVYAVPLGIWWLVVRATRPDGHWAAKVALS
jgi:hypothetical protein